MARVRAEVAEQKILEHLLRLAERVRSRDPNGAPALAGAIERARCPLPPAWTKPASLLDPEKDGYLLLMLGSALKFLEKADEYPGAAAATRLEQAVMDALDPDYLQHPRPTTDSDG